MRCSYFKTAGFGTGSHITGLLVLGLGPLIGHLKVFHQAAVNDVRTFGSPEIPFMRLYKKFQY